MQLLLARLTWDWELYEEYFKGTENQELKEQICRMDICHYAFPEHLERMFIGIGEMKPIKDFEGCGSYNKDIKQFIKNELNALIEMEKSYHNKTGYGKENMKRAWLTACLIKTLKEQTELTEPLLFL